MMTNERILLSISVIVFIFGGIFVEIFAMDEFLWYRTFLWSLTLFATFFLLSLLFVAVLFVVNLVKNKSDDVNEN